MQVTPVFIPLVFVKHLYKNFKLHLLSLFSVSRPVTAANPYFVHVLFCIAFFNNVIFIHFLFAHAYKNDSYSLNVFTLQLKTSRKCIGINPETAKTRDGMVSLEELPQVHGSGESLIGDLLMGHLTHLSFEKNLKIMFVVQPTLNMQLELQWTDLDQSIVVLKWLSQSPEQY